MPTHKKPIINGQIKCATCASMKELMEFSLDKTQSTGRDASCRVCTRKAAKAYYLAHRDEQRSKARERARKRRLKFREECKRKDREYFLKNRDTLRTKRHKRAVMERYGITHQQFDELIASHGGKCAICGDSETRQNNWFIYHLCVDHDHKSGRVRGLLCTNCNRLLGAAKDSIYVLEKAILYLLRAHEEGRFIRAI